MSQSVTVCQASVQGDSTGTQTQQGVLANPSTYYIPQEIAPNSPQAIDPIAHFEREFCQGSAIAPELYAIAVQVRDNEEISAGHDVSYPIYEALGRDRVRFHEKHSAHDFGAGAILLQESGKPWQVKPLNPLLGKDGKPIRYMSPEKSTEQAYLPPVNREIFRAICHRHRLDFAAMRDERDAIGSFWGWVAAHPELPLVITEGGKKSLALLTQGFIAIGFVGCWNATRIKDANGKRLDKPVLTEDLKRFAVKGRAITIALDVDLKPKTIATVKKANRRTAQALLAEGCTVSIALWDNDDGQAKGVDDLIVNRGVEALEQALAAAEPATLELTPIPAWAVLSSESIARGAQNVLADHLQEKIGDRLAWNVTDQTWISYNADPIKSPGLWLPVKAEFVQEKIRREFEWMNSELDLLASEREDVFPNTGYTARQIEGVCAQLRMRLACNRFSLDRDLLPFQNGVLQVSTGKFSQGHKPSDRLTWQLPYCYRPEATCQPILEWLQETTGGDRLQVELLRGYLKAVLLGRADLQRYLEIIGPGGTGKSTFTRLAQALVGYQNTHSTTLRELETNRFEAANLLGKRLILVADSDRWGGSVSTLKCITGGDAIRVERKFVQESESVAIAGMVIVTANEMLQSSDYTSGLQRRRLTLRFGKQIDPAQQTDLISVSAWGVSGLFADCLPGLVNWVLGCDDATMVALVRDTAHHIPSLDRWRNEAMLDCNPMAQWVDERLVIDQFSREKVGMADGDQAFNLYPNYCDYMKAAGGNPVSLRRFSTLLEDLLVSQLKFKGVERGRDRFGAFVTGIKIRTPDHMDDRPITGPLNPPIAVTESEPIAHAPEPEPVPILEPEPSTEAIPEPSTERSFQPGDRVFYHYRTANREIQGQGTIKKLLDNGNAAIEPDDGATIPPLHPSKLCRAA